MSSAPGQNLSRELHTCSGIGWIKFDQESMAQRALGPIPVVRCLGQRLLQESLPSVTAGHHGDHASPEAPGKSSVIRRRPLTVPREHSGGFVRVNEPTMALFCAGQLAILLPPTAPSSGTASASSNSLADAPSVTPCHVRCRGLSFRLDTKPDAKINAEKSTARQPRTAHEEEPLLTETVDAGATELLGKFGRGLDLLGGRVSAILFKLRDANTNLSGPQQFSTDTVHAAGRIVTQSGKVAKRSAEHVGQIVTFPYRYLNGTDGQGGANEDVEPRPGNE